MEDKLRLNKFLAKWGNISRLKAEEHIKRGRVFVSGKRISQSSFLVDPKKDKVRIQKKYISAQSQEKKVYLMFHKPTKVLSSSFDPKGRPTVMDFIPKTKQRLFLVGRLDWDSEGLLLLTNDGDFSHQVLNPKSSVSKTYLVKIKGQIKDSELKKLIKGVSTPVGKRRALFAKQSKRGDIKVILKEGKKRQIRLMFNKLGFPVQKLKRVAIGRLKLNRLPRRHFISLTEKDIKKIFLYPKELKGIRIK